MVVDFSAAKAAKQKTRYIITIGDDEEPAFAAAELTPGTTTVIITARTPEEAARLWKQSKATRQTR